VKNEPSKNKIIHTYFNQGDYMSNTEKKHELTKDHHDIMKKLKNEGKILWMKASNSEVKLLNFLVKQGLVKKNAGPRNADFFTLSGEN
jgi:adenylate kinase